MNRALLDTDIVSEISKARNAELVARAQAYVTQHSRFTISAVTVMEIVRGFHWAGRVERLSVFLANLASQEVLAFGQSTAMLAGKIDADLLRAGQPIGRADPMIAATAIEHGLVLVTGNTDHFARVQALGYSLSLENWRVP